MYNYFTAVMTIGVLTFLALYTTNFIQIVTLGGTVLGAACIGIFSALGAWILQKVRQDVLRRGLEMLLSFFVLIAVVHLLPGWKWSCFANSFLFAFCLSAAITGISEIVWRSPCGEEKQKNGGK
ncbi:MAG: hypothetical protein SPI01_01445 [Succiniclasticum sp.]|nr:hypothetical protein [Succiniclasticum sp.]